jgi:DNA-binding transcriptional regulator YiaG
MDGKKLREIRQELSLLQTDIAWYLGVDNETVCRWERREVKLSKLVGDAVSRLQYTPDLIAQVRGSRRTRKIARRLSKN